MAIAASPPPRPRRHLRLVRDGDVAARGCFVPVEDAPRGYQLSLSLVHVPRGQRQERCKSARRRETSAERWLRLVRLALEEKAARPLERLTSWWRPPRQHRSRAMGRIRSRRARRLLKAEVRGYEDAGVFADRPRIGNGIDGDCPTGPCPWVACRHHLFLEVDEDTGAIKLNFPGKDFDEIGETCSLREAAAGVSTVPKVGIALGISIQRVHQLEAAAMRLFKIRVPRDAVDD